MRLSAMSHGILLSSCTLLAEISFAQTTASTPIAIVPVEGVKLTGALDIADGRAMIPASGTVTASDHAATITLPHRGNLKICPTTKVSLTADSSIGAPSAPGLMLALDRGAIEASFATGKSSDVILTPDFRILISGPGTASVQVRLGAKGDTCVDNRGPNAAYVAVSSIFDGGVYRVQSDQRVMFQHGSLREVIDQEKEFCGCPSEIPRTTLPNEFPLAQSEGLAPLQTPPPNATNKNTVSAQITAQLAYDGTRPPATIAATPAETDKSAGPSAPKPESKPQSRPGFLRSLGHFFKKVFGG